MNNGVIFHYNHNTDFYQLSIFIPKFKISMKNSTKDTIKFIAAIIVLAAGVIITFLSLYLPPTGIIDSSVLTWCGEVFTFVGAIWGISEHSMIKIKEIDRAAHKDKDEEDL